MYIIGGTHPFGFNVVIACMPDIALVEEATAVVDIEGIVDAMVFATELSMLMSIVEVSIEELPIEEPPIEEPPMDDEFIPMVVIEGESRPRPGPA